MYDSISEEIGNQKLLDDISKCIVANKYKAQIVENRPLGIETEHEDVPPSRRESKQFPQCFRTEVVNFGNGEESGNSMLAATHVPMIIPIFAPRTGAPPKREKKRKMTAAEDDKSIEIKEERCPNTARTISMVPGACLATTNVGGEGGRLFDEFFVVGIDEAQVGNTAFVQAHSTNLFQYPNLPVHRDW